MTSDVPYAEVIGDPISHSKSPLIHKFWLKKLGLKGDYRAVHVRRNELADYIIKRRKDANWRGSNVTIPHKAEALALVDSRDELAAEVGATNCIYRSVDGLSATNADCSGVLAAIGHFEPPFCLLGNGGAARAALSVLDPHSKDQVRVLVRDFERGCAMVQSMSPLVATVYDFNRLGDALSGCKGLINATSLGMKGSSPVPAGLLDALENLSPGAIVFDMVYAPLQTPLLQRAGELGFHCIDGLVMLIGQAARAFELFFGEPAPRQYDVELRELLTA